MIQCDKCGGELANTGVGGELAMMAVKTMTGPDGPLIERHYECVNGHIFHATGPEDSLTALPRFGQLPCPPDCKWGQRAAGQPNSN